MTDNTNASRGPEGLKGNKSLASHPEPGKLAAHPEPARIVGHTDADDATPVPAVTADVDEAPRGVRYGAAIILGLAFGIGCYLWFGTDNSSLPEATSAVKMAPTAEYFNQPGANAPIGESMVSVPDPFNSPYEPTLDAVGEVVMTSNVASANTSQAAKKAAEGTATTTKAATAAATTAPVVALFAYDSYEVPSSDALETLAANAAATGADVDINAYTDPNGRSSYNRKLSARRAQAVKQYLCEHGVDPSHIHTNACGATDAYSTDAQNRRAEISLR